MPDFVLTHHRKSIFDTVVYIVTSNFEYSTENT